MDHCLRFVFLDFSICSTCDLEQGLPCLSLQMNSQIFSTTAWFEDDKGPYRLTETSDLLPSFLIEVCVDAVALNKSLQISLL